MNLSKTVKKLCTPARFYLGISIFMILLLIVQNLFNNNSSQLCVGSYKTDVSRFVNVTVLLLVKVLYVVFWTWLLNVLCKNGFKSVSWFLVLLPFILFAVVLVLLLYTDHEAREEQEEQAKHRNMHHIEPFFEYLPQSIQLPSSLYTCMGDCMAADKANMGKGMATGMPTNNADMATSMAADMEKRMAASRATDQAVADRANWESKSYSKPP